MRLTRKHEASVVYHDLFDYPLNESELDRWQLNVRLKSGGKVVSGGGYFHLSGKTGLVAQRKKREKYSQKKFRIAKNAARLLSKIPTVKLVAVTGSLAMRNASRESDIDLMIVASKGTLWATRAVVAFTFYFLPFTLRRAGEPERPDSLCFNMWMDESDLAFEKARQDIYTAHEIAQITPLVNKDGIYERILEENKWLLEYWPSSVAMSTPHQRRAVGRTAFDLLLETLEPVARSAQWKYMQGKRTRETVTKTRAMFHPRDWSKEAKMLIVTRS